MSILTDVFPPAVRQAVYIAYAAAALVLGSVQAYVAAAGAGQPEWLIGALAVLAFIGTAFGLTAASNIAYAPVVDGVAQITTLPALPTLAVLTEADRAALVELRAALADDRAPATDPAVTALDHVLT